jgi:hypothetical protein
MGITVDEKELREILELTPCEQNIMIAGMRLRRKNCE